MNFAEIYVILILFHGTNNTKLEIILMNGEFLTASQTAKKWDITQRRVQILCAKGRIDGVFKLGENWAIPANAQKPIDRRIKKEKENV